MKQGLAIIVAIGMLLLIAVAPHSASAHNRQPTPTPTPTPGGSAPTPTPSGTVPTPTSTPTGTSPTPTPTPQPLIVITADFSCANGVCTLGPGNVGTFFNEYVTSSGGQGPTPYTWKLVSGSLPAGLSMDKNFGVYSTQIAGTPTQVQTTNFTLQVTDGVGDTAQQAFTLTINPPLPLVITSGSCCPDGTVGTAYQTNFFASGGGAALHLVDLLRTASTGSEARRVATRWALRHPDDERNVHLYGDRDRQHRDTDVRAGQHHHLVTHADSPEVVEGDFFKDPIPAGRDAVLLANVIHLSSPEHNLELLRRTRERVPDGARLLLVDFWSDATHTQPPFAALMADEFLVITGEGDVYSEEEAHRWLSGHSCAVSVCSVSMCYSSSPR